MHSKCAWQRPLRQRPLLHPLPTEPWAVLAGVYVVQGGCEWMWRGPNLCFIGLLGGAVPVEGVLGFSVVWMSVGYAVIFDGMTFCQFGGWCAWASAV